MQTNELLARIMDAHGGIDRWNQYEKVDAKIVSGGGFFRLKGVPQDSTPRRMTVWLHEERSSVFPFGASDQRTMFTPEWVGSRSSTARSLPALCSQRLVWWPPDAHTVGRASSSLF